MKRQVTQYVLYRWRYLLSYIFATILVLLVFIYGAFFIPEGLQAAEKTTAVLSNSLSFSEFDPTSVINLPYHLVQRASFAVLGVTTLSIKLPSLLFGVLAIAGLFLLIKEWFRPNIAIITGLIAVTMPAFIFAAQDATPTIFSIAISFWLLLAATRVIRGSEPRTVWKVLSFILFSLNLYTPLGIYLNLAIISTMIFHPHIRLVMHRFNINYVAIGVAVAVLLSAPLIYSVVIQPQLGFELVGIPQQPIDFGLNAIVLIETLFGSYGERLPFAPPIISVGLLSVLVIGLSRFFIVKHTARSYITWLWFLTLLPLLLLSPQYAPLLVPLIVIIAAMGITTLIAEWYRLFPRNPYARVFGLLPLGLIVLGLSIAGISRYTAAYNYTPSIASRFDNDVKILEQAVEAADEFGDNKIHVVVNEEDEAFYGMIADYSDDFYISSDLKVPTPFIASGDYEQREAITADPQRIFTSRLKADADRFYLYTEVKK